MIKNLLTRGAVTAGVLLLGASIQAGSFQGSTSGTFENATGPGVPTYVSGEGTDTFVWGDPIAPSGPSSLAFSGVGFDTDPGVWFPLGELTYENGTSRIGTGADSVDLAVTLTFTLPAIPGEVFTYTFNLVNTVNTDDPEDSSDIVDLPESVATTIFAGGQTYNLTLAFGEILGGGGFVPAPNQFRVLEGDSATVGLNGLITVPDGGLTLALFGAALGSLGIFSRRNKD